jgi:hypothetical protein
MHQNENILIRISYLAAYNGPRLILYVAIAAKRIAGVADLPSKFKNTESILRYFAKNS